MCLYPPSKVQYVMLFVLLCHRRLSNASFRALLPTSRVLALCTTHAVLVIPCDPVLCAGKHTSDHIATASDFSMALSGNLGGHCVRVLEGVCYKANEEKKKESHVWWLLTSLMHAALSALVILDDIWLALSAWFVLFVVLRGLACRATSIGKQ